jgi:hypothetical protein
MSIRAKLLLILSFVAILAAGISGLIDYRTARTSLEEESFKKLTAAHEMKANQVEDYFRTIRDQVTTLSRDIMVVDAVRSFSAAFREIEAELGLPDYWPKGATPRILHDLYISSNPNSAGSKHNLDGTADASAYTRAHRKYHPIIRDYLETFGFYDFFFVDEDWFFFCVGDVSDKGVPTALFMAVAKTLIKSRATDEHSPSSVMTGVNEELSQDNPSCMFVTVLAARLLRRSRSRWMPSRLSLARPGHG